MSSNIEYLRSGLRKIRDAALLNIISYILSIAFYISIFFFIMTFPPSVFIISLITFLISLILGLIALFAFLIPGFEDLRDYDPSNFNTPCILIKIGLVGGLILMLISVVLLFYLISIGVSVHSLMYHVFYIHQMSASMIMPEIYMEHMIFLIGVVELLFLISLILLLIGYIGIIIGMFRLREITDEDLFLAAGIIFIISIFLPIMDFVGWILTFIGASEAMKRVKEGA
ncbi:MAG: DUF973 family protein [Crenarchaeota archaeon]|nr:DUF973 family protein [Thermoproteota archaeon]